MSILSIALCKGTLTANKMTARALYAADMNLVVENPKQSLGDYVKEKLTVQSVLDTVAKTISIDTMNETVLEYDKDGALTGSAGNGKGGA